MIFRNFRTHLCDVRRRLFVVVVNVFDTRIVSSLLEAHGRAFALMTYTYIAIALRLRKRYEIRDIMDSNTSSVLLIFANNDFCESCVCVYIENENVMSCARNLISFDIIIQLINNYKYNLII